MDIIYLDYYSSDNNIINIYNYYIIDYLYYKKQKDISIFLLKYHNEIKGMLCFKIRNKLCEICFFEIFKSSENYSLEFIYYIGNYIYNNFIRIIFNNINNKLLKKLYITVLKYNNYFIYDSEKKPIYNFIDNINNNINNNINTNLIYDFYKIELNQSRSCINCFNL